MSEFVQISPEAQRLVERAADKPALLNAVRLAMDKQNVLTVSHIQERYLSFASDGPSQKDGLRVQTGSLRRSLRASPATVSGSRVEGGIGGNVTHKGVNYLAVHEFGATIPPHTITATRGKCLAFSIRGQTILRKSVKHPGMTLPARGMIHRGIEDRLPQYGAALSQAIIDSMGGKN